MSAKKPTTPFAELVADQAEIEAQEKLPKNKLSFEEAAEKAVDAILHSDAIESPRDIWTSVAPKQKGDYDSEEEYEKAVEKQLKEFMGEATAYLVPREVDEEAKPKIFPPENGESVEDNWVFYFTLPISDHIYWAIVDRSGEKEATCYGFN